MKIEVLKPYAGYEQIWGAIAINDEYLVEMTFTIYFSTRISIREPNDMNIMCNWCAGRDLNDIVYLVNTLLGYVEKGDEHKIPFCSNRKPIANDEKFSALIAPYHTNTYFQTVVEMLATVTSKTTESYESESAIPQRYFKRSTAAPE